MSMPLFFILTPITLMSLFAFVSQRHHVLMCLLSLEAVLLSLAFSVVITSSSPFYFFYCIIILSFGACEAAVALAVLVIITRSFGSDLLQSIMLNKC